MSTSDGRSIWSSCKRLEQGLPLALLADDSLGHREVSTLARATQHIQGNLDSRLRGRSGPDHCLPVGARTTACSRLTAGETEAASRLLIGGLWRPWSSTPTGVSPPPFWGLLPPSSGRPRYKLSLQKGRGQQVRAVWKEC